MGLKAQGHSRLLRLAPQPSRRPRDPSPSVDVIYHSRPAACSQAGSESRVPARELPIWVIRTSHATATLADMSTSLLSSYSDAMADAVAAVAPSVVQVSGRRRPLSGLICEADIVLTNARALGREDHLKVRAHDGRVADAELAGWDPSTGLAILRAPGLGASCRGEGGHAAARRRHRPGGRAIVEQRRDGERRDHRGHRRPAAHRPSALDRAGDPDDDPDARGVRRRPGARRVRAGHRHLHRRGDPRLRGRHSGRRSPGPRRPRFRSEVIPPAGSSGSPATRFSSPRRSVPQQGRSTRC